MMKLALRICTGFARTVRLILACCTSFAALGCSWNHADLHAVLLQRIEPPSNSVGGLRRGDDPATVQAVIQSAHLRAVLEPKLASLVKHPHDVLASVHIREESGRNVAGSVVYQPVILTIAGNDGDDLNAALRAIVAELNSFYPTPLLDTREPSNKPRTESAPSTASPANPARD